MNPDQNQKQPATGGSKEWQAHDAKPSDLQPKKDWQPKDWHSMLAAMQAQAQAVDWSKMDWSKLNASDIGVRFGKPMTEAEFQEYRKARGNRVQVVKATAAAQNADTKKS